MVRIRRINEVAGNLLSSWDRPGLVKRWSPIRYRRKFNPHVRSGISTLYIYEYRSAISSLTYINRVQKVSIT